MLACGGGVRRTGTASTLGSQRVGGRRRVLPAVAALCLLVPACGSPAGPGSNQGATPSPNGTTSTGEGSVPPVPEPTGGTGQDGKTQGGPTNALVTRVNDGDTVEARFGGRIIHVRLIGIDTPETVHPAEPVQCFGQAASDFTTRSLEGERVRLEFDVEHTDRYGRTLAYVWLHGTLFNEVLVREGYAQVSTYPPDVKYVDRFLVAQRFARNNDRGLWAACASGGGKGGGGGNCDPSYPDVCIPSPPPDLDCADIAFRRFRVVGSDPHHFDGDHNGIGCET